MSVIVRSQTEIDEVLNVAQDFIDGGGSPFFGMSYEDGIIGMYRWLIGEEDENPLVQR